MLQYGKFENILLYRRSQAEKDNCSLILFAMIENVWKDDGDDCITLWMYLTLLSFAVTGGLNDDILCYVYFTTIFFP